MDEKKEDKSEESMKNHRTYYRSLSKIITNMKNEINEEGEPAIKEHLTSRIDAMEKDKMFSQIKRRIDDCWEAIMNNITHQPEKDFLNEVLENLRVFQIESKNVN